MRDYKEYLQEKKLVLNIKEEMEKSKKVFQSRNQLLTKAKGAIRQYLQQQILDAIHRMNNEKAPTGYDAQWSEEFLSEVF